MQDGRIMMSENIPITVENLATITHKSTKKIQNILNKLIHFEMIILEDNIYRIKNWDKYQSTDKDENNVNITLGNDTEENKKENNRLENKKKYVLKRLDDKIDIKRKYKLIIEEVYQYESDSPEDIERIINSYVNYT